VGTAPAAIGAIPIQLDALGTVTPPVTATITSRIAGQLMAVYFTEGQAVKKGQKLALIDPRPYQVALEQAQGTLARDQAALANARLDLQRYTTLLAQNSIAKQQVDTQAALVKQDEAVVKTDQAAVSNARLNLAYTSITAPVAGRVGLRQVDVGNYINGSSTPLVILTQVDPIDVVFTVPEDNVPQIVARQRAGAALPVTVFNRGGVDALGQGQLSTLDNQIDPATGTVKAKARFTNGSGALFPNQFVNARMLVDVLCNVVTVPTTAVRHGSAGADYVFTLQPDRTAKMTPVTVGPGTGEMVSISKGLMGNETVITEGGDRLRDGSQVNLPGDRTQGGSGFSGGRRRNGGAGPGGGAGGAPGASAGRQGGQGGGQSGFRRRGGQGGPPGGAAAAPAADAEPASPTVQGLPTAQVPPGACSAAGKGQGQGFAGRRFGGAPGAAGAPGAMTGPRAGGAPQGQGPQGQGFQRRFGQGQAGPGQVGAGQAGPGGLGQGGPGQGGQGFRRRPGGPGGAPGQGQPQGQGQAG
jgi:multidrug efflux system membrane fusion protein